ncbi:hypothetical protein [Saliterribacillus persicus]|uniref:Uncharacterized protein YpmB n=1 Tax=Saliterribacillus persicus TaxID=930114 RepID=A0A368XAG0_9BACI|nr:hypothetical protein [Saliterribacillus persicus]RCW64940.1 uncharacterized protein YpmB [Saliterribacillus persicus]
MKKQSSRFTVPNKLFLFVTILSVITISIISYSVHLYQEVVSDRDLDLNEVEAYVKEESAIVQISEIDRYHGDMLFHAVKGKTEDGKELLVFFYEEDDVKEIITYEMDNLMSKEEIMNNWSSTCDGCELLGSSFGMDNEVPVVEIKYIDQEERLVYEYVQLSNGESYTLRLKQAIY